MADPSPLSDLPMPRSVWTLDTLYLWVKERIDRVEEGTKLQLTSAKEAVGAAKVEGHWNGVAYRCTSCDQVDFSPLRIIDIP